MSTPKIDPPVTNSFTRRRFIQTAGIVGVGASLGVSTARPARSLANRETQAAKGPIQDVVPCAARPLPMTAVRLTGGPLKHAQDLNAAYLLKLEPNRMMAYLRKEAGLAPQAKGYGGWDSDGKSLAGHIAGHYLSAVSLMYAATGDARFRQRADILVSELKIVQDANGDGYLGAQEDGKAKYKELASGVIRSGGFDLNGLWSPWYVQHKIFAGLRDAYRYTGNKTALSVEKKFAAWVEATLSGLDDAQDQKMLNTEFGGMNEVMADLYADTGDKRWLALYDKFQHRAVIEPLSRRQEILGGLHGNTQIPKLIGSLSRYVYTGNAADGVAARFFWDSVVEHHTFATGGHGQNEYFGPPDMLSAHVEGRTDESCNVYNMLKMTRELFALHPDIKYAEFHERALFNHVLGSIDPEDGRTCYMVPVGQGVQREYQDMFESFTCCVGTGMESHALHAYGIYYTAGDKLWVNLYAPTNADWKAQGARLSMTTNFPEGETATLKITLSSPKDLTLALRRPAWAGEGFRVAVNGKAVSHLSAPGSYIEIKRRWKSGDIVTLSLPKTLRTEPLPDNPSRAALMWGPLVLAGDLGPERGDDTPLPTVPVFTTSEWPLAEWLKPIPGKPGQFRSVGASRNPGGDGQTMEVIFTPFHRLHRRSYAAYWDLYTSGEWTKKAAEIAAEQEKQHKLEAATVAYAQPGQMQTERDFNQQGEDTSPDRLMGHAARRGRQWFSFDLPVDPAHPMALIVTYNAQERDTRTFEIQVNGAKVGAQTVERGLTPKFYDITYAIPADLVVGKTKVTVRFQAAGGKEIAAVYGIRMIRADQALN
jgi:DUF1680 family protein